MVRCVFTRGWLLCFLAVAATVSTSLRLTLDASGTMQQDQSPSAIQGSFTQSDRDIITSELLSKLGRGGVYAGGLAALVNSVDVALGDEVGTFSVSVDLTLSHLSALDARTVRWLRPVGVA